MNDVLAHLADANPVRSEDLAPLEFPDGVHSLRPPRRVALASAGFAAAVVAALIGVFVYPGAGSHHVIRPGLSSGPASPAGPAPFPTVDDPLPIGGERVSLADAEAALGAPIVLPDTSPMGSPDAGSVWLNDSRLDSVVAVTYPTADLWILYETGANLDHDDVLLSYNAGARQSTPFRVIDLDGVPAIAAAWNSQDLTDLGSLSSQADGVRVTILGRQDDSTMQALARSIIRGYPSPPAGQLGDVRGIQLFTYFPPARQIDLADASATLGAPVVLPDTPLASPSDAGPAWAERHCPAPEGSITEWKLLHACWIWISFPSTGLSVGYLRPPEYRGTHGEWELQARLYGDNAKVIDLGEIPALAIEPQDPYPGSVEFDLDGTRIVVAGNYDTATLQTVAQSIVDRSK